MKRCIKRPLYKIFLFVFGILSLPFVLFKYLNNRRENQYEKLKEDIADRLIKEGVKDKIIKDTEEH